MAQIDPQALIDALRMSDSAPQQIADVRQPPPGSLPEMGGGGIGGSAGGTMRSVPNPAPMEQQVAQLQSRLGQLQGEQRRAFNQGMDFNRSPDFAGQRAEMANILALLRGGVYFQGNQ